MTEPLSVDADGVRSLGEIHNRVAAGLGSLAAASPGPAAVAGSHGTIAAAVDTALTGALGSRSGTLAGTRTAGDTISELLHQAALAYERGDHRGAEAIRTAADQMAHGPTRAAGRAAGAAPPPGAHPQAAGPTHWARPPANLGSSPRWGSSWARRWPPSPSSPSCSRRVLRSWPKALRRKQDRARPRSRTSATGHRDGSPTRSRPPTTTNRPPKTRSPRRHRTRVPHRARRPVPPPPRCRRPHRARPPPDLPSASPARACCRQGAEHDPLLLRRGTTHRG